MAKTAVRTARHRHGEMLQLVLTHMFGITEVELVEKLEGTAGKGSLRWTFKSSHTDYREDAPTSADVYEDIYLLVEAGIVTHDSSRHPRCARFLLGVAGPTLLERRVRPDSRRRRSVAPRNADELTQFFLTFALGLVSHGRRPGQGSGPHRDDGRENVRMSKSRRPTPCPRPREVPQLEPRRTDLLVMQECRRRVGGGERERAPDATRSPVRYRV